MAPQRPWGHAAPLHRTFPGEVRNRRPLAEGGLPCFNVAVKYVARFRPLLIAAAVACTDPVPVEVESGTPNGFVTGNDLFENEAGASTAGGGSAGLDLLDPQATCAVGAQAAEQRSVAMYIMLDSSASMEEPTGAGFTKWQSIQRAIRTFMSENREDDLSIGLQFFPLLKAGSSFTCTRQSDCGSDGGPCFLQTCLLGDTITLCTDRDDCPGTGNDCVTFGLCENSDPDNPLACVLGGRCQGDLGACQDFERVCTQATECQVPPYATPAVEIGQISERIAQVDAALSAQPPRGLTPTAPAISGAVQHARDWALTHPDQAVVVVLATDGLPTECRQVGEDEGVPDAEVAELAIQEVADIAGLAVLDEAPVRTFVIGVFQPGDGLSINNVNRIASAGGTEQAVFIDTSGAVEEQFLEALRGVQTQTLACEFQIPESDEQLDYFTVNLQFDDGTGPRQLGFVPSADDCAGNPGSWHYDVHPNVGRPSAIEVCPDVCTEFDAATQGSISVQLGCETIIR